MFRKLPGTLVVLMIAPIVLADPAPEISAPVLEVPPAAVDMDAPAPSFSVTPGMASSVHVGVFELTSVPCVPTLVLFGNDDGSFDIEDGFGGKIDYVPPGTGSIDIRVPRYAWKASFVDGAFVAELVPTDDTRDGPVVNGSISVGCRKRPPARCNYGGTCCTGPSSDADRRCGPTTDFTVGGGEVTTVSCNSTTHPYVHISTW